MNASGKIKFPSSRSRLPFALLAAALVAVAHAQTPIATAELVGPKVAISGSTMKLTVQPSVSGRRYQLQSSATMATGTWQDLGPVRIGDGNNLVISTPYDAAVPGHFYRLVLDESPTAPEGFAYIPAGSFQMGDQANPPVGFPLERPVHGVSLSGFYMGQTEVTKAQWDGTYSWATANGYGFDNPGAGKATNHPVHSVNWFDMVKWCNARSQQEGLQPCYTAGGATYRTGQEWGVVCDFTKNGYRLPTEAEWEKAARGGPSAQNFPWGDTITHGQANYYSIDWVTYDISATRGYHPTYDDGPAPYTSAVGSFAASGYGLYDMAGNVSEWCWDWFGSYPSALQDDPRGPASGSGRVYRGGSWTSNSLGSRVAFRDGYLPSDRKYDFGFRPARSSVP